MIDVLSRYRAFLIDIDGVLVRGATRVPGSIEALARLRSRGETVLLSNNSSRSRESLSNELASLGFAVTRETLVPSCYVAARYLASMHGVVRFWLIGEDGLREELLLAGHRASARPEDAQWVVAGWDRGVTYQTFVNALRALRSGARLLATNTDPTFPASDGLLPGAGVIVGALRGMGYPPEIVTGKPSPVAFEVAMERLTVPRDQVLVIGDRLETDIAGGAGVGLDTALVLTGVTGHAEIDDAKTRPTWKAGNLDELSRGRMVPTVP